MSGAFKILMYRCMSMPTRCFPSGANAINGAASKSPCSGFDFSVLSSFLAASKSAIGSRKTLPFFPATITLCSPSSEAAVIPKPASATFVNCWLLSLSFRRQTSPDSEHTMALFASTATTAVNVSSIIGPSRQLRPGRILCKLLGVLGDSGPDSSLSAEEVAAQPSTRQTLTCLVPTVTMLLPIHTIWQMLLVHLLLECNAAAPFLLLMAQTYRKPSLAAPKLARNCEFGLNATDRRPKVWSGRQVSGASDEDSFEVENISTRGLYPVCMKSAFLVLAPVYSMPETNLSNSQVSSVWAERHAGCGLYAILCRPRPASRRVHGVAARCAKW